MSFPRLNSMPRTDHIFRNRLQPEHHKQYSLLESLDINMVEQFPTSDPFHLLDLGVMKICLFQWINGCDEFTSEWSKQQQAQVNEALIQCNKKIPSEFHRSIRSLNYIHVGKGQNTEHSYCTSELLFLKKKYPWNFTNIFCSSLVLLRYVTVIFIKIIGLLPNNFSMNTSKITLVFMERTLLLVIFII